MSELVDVDASYDAQTLPSVGTSQTMVTAAQTGTNM